MPRPRSIYQARTIALLLKGELSMLCSRSSLAMLLSLGLFGPALSPAANTPAQPPLSGDQRILHALNRFTFGPRPGDLQSDQPGSV